MYATPDVEARLASLEVRLTELEDRETIRNLIASYGPLADGGDATATAALWDPEGVYAVGGFGDNVGRAAIAALIEAPTHRGMMAMGCAHVLSPVQVELSGHTATAIGYSCVFLRRDAVFEVFRVSSNRWELRKSDGHWRVLLRTNRLLDGDEAARALLHREAQDGEYPTERSR